MKCRNKILSIAFSWIVILCTSSYYNAYADDEHSGSEDSSDTEASASNEQAAASTAPSARANPNLNAENEEAIKIARLYTAKLAELSKQLDAAIKSNDIKKIAELKKEYEGIKEEIQKQIYNLEERESPDGRVLPLSDSGKLVAQELAKSARLQYGTPAKRSTPKKLGIEDKFKKQEDKVLAEKETPPAPKTKPAATISDLAAAGLTSAVGAAATMFGNSVAPGLGTLVGTAATATNALIAARANPSDAANPVASHTYSAPQGDVLAPKEIEQALDEKEKQELNKATTRVKKISDELLYIQSELMLHEKDLDEASIAKLQKKTYDFIVELDKLHSQNQGSQDFDKAISEARDIAQQVLQVLADKNHDIAFGPNSFIGRPEQPQARISNPNRQAPGGDSSVDNEKLKPESKPPVKPTPLEDETWSEWVQRKASEGYEAAKEYASQAGDAIAEAWNSYMGSTPQGDNHVQTANNYYQQGNQTDNDGNMGKGNSPAVASTPVATSTPATQSSAPATAPKQATAQQSQPVIPTVPTLSPSAPTQPAQATAISGATGANNPNTRLVSQAARGIGIENTAAHIDENGETSNSSGTGTPVTTIGRSSLPGRNSAVRPEGSDRNVANSAGNNSDSVRRLSTSDRNQDGSIRRNSSNSRTSENYNNSNSSVNVSGGSSSSSSNQTGLQAVSPQAQQEALQNSQNGANDNNGVVGMQLRRRYPNPNGEDYAYSGPLKGTQSLFSDTDSPETLPKVSAKNPAQIGEVPRKAASGSAYEAPGANSTAESTPKTSSTVQDIIDGKDDKNSLQSELLLPKGVEEILPEEAKEEKEESIMAKLAKGLEDQNGLTQPLSTLSQEGRKIASQPSKKGIAPTNLKSTQASSSSSILDWIKKFFLGV